MRKMDVLCPICQQTHPDTHIRLADFETGEYTCPLIGQKVVMTNYIPNAKTTILTPGKTLDYTLDAGALIPVPDTQNFKESIAPYVPPEIDLGVFIERNSIFQDVIDSENDILYIAPGGEIRCEFSSVDSSGAMSVSYHFRLGEVSFTPVQYSYVWPLQGPAEGTDNGFNGASYTKIDPTWQDTMFWRVPRVVYPAKTTDNVTHQTDLVQEVMLRDGSMVGIQYFQDKVILGYSSNGVTPYSRQIIQDVQITPGVEYTAYVNIDSSGLNLKFWEKGNAYGMINSPIEVFLPISGLTNPEPVSLVFSTTEKLPGCPDLLANNQNFQVADAQAATLYVTFIRQIKNSAPTVGTTPQATPTAQESIMTNIYPSPNPGMLLQHSVARVMDTEGDFAGYFSRVSDPVLYLHNSVPGVPASTPQV